MRSLCLCTFRFFVYEEKDKKLESVEGSFHQLILRHITQINIEKKIKL